MKKFSSTNSSADVDRPPKQYQGSIHHISAPNPYNLDVCTPALPTYMYPQKLAFKSKKALFSRKCCFCCVLGVAFVVFQNLVNQELLLPIFFFYYARGDLYFHINTFVSDELIPKKLFFFLSENFNKIFLTCAYQFKTFQK